MIQEHISFPSIVMYVIFNEGWGQYETERVTRAAQSLDPSRLYNGASGWCALLRLLLCTCSVSLSWPGLNSSCSRMPLQQFLVLLCTAGSEAAVSEPGLKSSKQPVRLSCCAVTLPDMRLQQILCLKSRPMALSKLLAVQA